MKNKIFDNAMTSTTPKMTRTHFLVEIIAKIEESILHYKTRKKQNIPQTTKLIHLDPEALSFSNLDLAMIQQEGGRGLRYRLNMENHKTIIFPINTGIDHLGNHVYNPHAMFVPF